LDWERDVEDVRDGVERKDTPDVVSALGEQIADENAEGQDIAELRLQECHNPARFKDVDVL
jgi:hypothetical protein